MSTNNQITDKTNFKLEPGIPAGQKYNAIEFNTIKNFQNEPVQKLTTLDDTNVLLDGSKSYSSTIVVTLSTRTITAAVSGHLEGNIIKARYQFNIDCTITLVNFDATGNQTGVITPIKAGTYDFFFKSVANGVNLDIPGNQLKEQDYKIWYVDDINGADTRTGSITDPVATIQKAYDLRIADGSSGRGVIKIMTSGSHGGIVATITNLKTSIVADFPDIELGDISITDADIILDGFVDTGEISINQTGANICRLELMHCNLDGHSDVIIGNIADTTKASIYVKHGAIVRIGSATPDVKVYAQNEAQVIVDDSGLILTSMVFSQSLLFLGSSDTLTVGTLTFTRGFCYLSSNSSLTITTSFAHVGVAFTRQELITVSGSESFTPGQWSKSELLTKIIEIGDWDMDANASPSIIVHGLDVSKIREFQCLIINDADQSPSQLDRYTNGLSSGIVNFSPTNVLLTRAAGGEYDNTDYDTTPKNRGWVTIKYII